MNTPDAFNTEDAIPMKSDFDKVISLPSYKFTLIVLGVVSLVAFALWRDPNATLTFLGGCIAGTGLKVLKSQS